MIRQISLYRVILVFLISGNTLNSQTNSLNSFSNKVQSFYAEGKNDSALIFADKLLSKAKQKDSMYFIIKGFYLKGLVLYALDRPKEAMDNYYFGLKLCKDTSENILKAKLYNNLGLVNYDQKNIGLAKYYFKEEIKIRKEIGDTGKIVSCLINLSAMHRRLKELDSASFVLKDAEKILVHFKDPRISGYYYQSKGTQLQTLYKRDSLMPLLDSAVVYYSKASAIWFNIGEKDEALLPLFNMGLIYQSKGEFGKALINYKKAEEVVNELDLKNKKVTVYGNLAELYFDLKDYKQSADYFRSYSEIKDELQKDEVNNYALELDKQMQTEQNKETIQKQQLELAEKDKRIYFILFVSVLVMTVLILVLIYFNFRKRLNTKIEEAKKKFFSNVVHEIRTPLSMIQAPLSVLKKKAVSTEDHENFELAEKNILRLNELISQMLDISKLDSDKYILNETFGDLEIFFRQIANNHTKIALEKNIGIVTDFDFDHKLAFFDKDALEKITGNLLGNAIKYSGNGSLVGINASSEETEQGLKVVLQVWDTGVGIPEKEQATIFNRFYRSTQTSDNTKGAGIGLALVKDLVDLQKGTIALVSKENSGSSFTIALSLKSSENLSASMSLLANHENTYHVLLVEDDQDILEFNAKYLEKNNFRVLRSSNTEEALKLIEKNLPDLIVSDLMMPGIDGAGLLNIIRKNPESDHIPFIMLSAKASPNSRIEVLKAGAQNYMVKPFLPDELVAVVASQLEILAKRKKEFKALIEEPKKKIEEKLEKTDPYTQKLFAIILKNLEDADFSVEKLADLMTINRSHFQRKVKALTGLSPSEIIKTVRMEKAKDLLLSKLSNVTEVAYSTGFSSQSYFTKCFTQYYGVSPTQMLQKESTK